MTAPQFGEPEARVKVNAAQAQHRVYCPQRQRGAAKNKQPAARIAQKSAQTGRGCFWGRGIALLNKGQLLLIRRLPRRS